MMPSATKRNVHKNYAPGAKLVKICIRPDSAIVARKHMAKRVQPDIETFARIRVVGVGGSGKNAVNHMIDSKVRGVEFVAINTDAQDLHGSLAKRKIHIGKNLTRGLGAGMNPEIGRRAAEETRQHIQEALQGADLVFITCGMGGGTGSGSAPVVAKIAKELGALTIAVVTKPFSFEGAQRKDIAERGLAELKKEVDAYIVIQNDKLLAIAEPNMSAKAAFALCDEILRQAVEGVSDIIRTPGDVNTDFNDIKAIMEGAGPALMGIGVAEGEERAKEAAKRAVNSPLLDISITGAKGILFVVAGSDDLGIMEVQDAAKIINETVDKNAKVIFGMMKDNKLKKGQIRIIVIATGFPEQAVHLAQERSLFSLPTERRHEERGKIYNEVLKRPEEIEEEPVRTLKEEPIVTAMPATHEDAPKPPVVDDDEEGWGAIPAFLRRHKK